MNGACSCWRLPADSRRPDVHGSFSALAVIPPRCSGPWAFHHWRMARLRERCRERVSSPLRTLANLLEAMREGDYSIRARGARFEDALGEVMQQVNAMGVSARAAPRRTRGHDATPQSDGRDRCRDVRLRSRFTTEADQPRGRASARAAGRACCKLARSGDRSG